MCWNNNYYHWYRNSLLYMTALAFQRCICQYMLTWLCIHLCRIITDYLENFSDDKKNSMNLWEVIVKAHARYVEVCCSSCLSVRALTLLFADNFCCISSFFSVSNWSHDIDPINVLFLLLGQCSSKKSVRLHCFKSDQHEICQIFSSIKYAIIDRVGFSIWHHTFKLTAMTSFHKWKCCPVKVLPSAECTCICSYISRLPFSNSVYSSWSTVHSYLFMLSACSICTEYGKDYC